MPRDDDKDTTGSGLPGAARPTGPSEFVGMAGKMRAEIRKDLDERLGRRPVTSEPPPVLRQDPARTAGAQPFGATQTCPACGGSGDGVSGAPCGCCGGRGWIGSD